MVGFGRVGRTGGGTTSEVTVADVAVTDEPGGDRRRETQSFLFR